MFDLAIMNVPLPEDIQKLKMYGDYPACLKLIQTMLEKELPTALRKRLLVEKEVLRVIGVNEYPYSFEEASKIMADNLQDYQEQELTHLKETGAADWIFIQGQVYFQRRFFENLVKTRPEYCKRMLHPAEDESGEKKTRLLNENIALMKKQGGRKVKITIEASIKAKKEFERPGEKVLVHLPIPRDSQQVSQIEIEAASPAITHTAAADAMQRTVSFETLLQPGQTFSIRYSYINTMPYVTLDPEKAIDKPYDFQVHEQGPHMVFTPYLKELLKEIIGAETNPVKKARKIYDFVTTKIMYSFMREYFTIDNISEYAASNLKGDCGVQAILFITLCRMAGIPAKWQSGLYVSHMYTGCHDWAQFYIEPYGWVFADLSFGGSAYRANDLPRWNHYFGNLDVFRMPANEEILYPFDPPKKQLRADPVDNQRGELEYADKGLLHAELDVEQKLIQMEELPYS